MNRFPIFVAAVLLSSASPALAIDNTAYGSAAGASITTGDGTVAVGTKAANKLTTGSAVIAVGPYAAHYQTSQTDLIAIGYAAAAGHLNYTTPTGENAPTTPPTPKGYDNICIGSYAGASLTTGSDNTLVGHHVGQRITSGYDNTLIGEEAGENLTTGTDNTCVGEDSCKELTKGRRNTALGNNAMYGSKSTTYTKFPGENYNNTAVGYEAGSDHMGTFHNASFGSLAGIDIGVGMCNTAIGAKALQNVEHADFNTAVGFLSGHDVNRTNKTTGSTLNTFMGAFSANSNREGSRNVVIGALADFNKQSQSAADLEMECKYTYWGGGVSAGPNNVSDTVIVGTNATGKATGVTCLGTLSYADKAGGIALGRQASVKHTNAVNIGDGSLSHGNNLVVFGNDQTVSWDPHKTGVTSLGGVMYRFVSAFVQGLDVMAGAKKPAVMLLAADAGANNDDKWRIQAADGGAFTVASYASGAYKDVFTLTNAGQVTISGDLLMNSDARLKEDVRPVSGALEQVCRVEARSFRWRAGDGAQDGRHLGFIAQDVQRVAPELVKQREDGMLAVNYTGFVPLLAGAVRELRAEMGAKHKALEEQVKLQREELTLLRKQVKLQQALLQKLASVEGRGL